MKLNDAVKEIRDVISKRQEELGLTFVEEDHIYTMSSKDSWPSVSKVLKKFYKEFSDKSCFCIVDFSFKGFKITKLG
jgi:fructoselysine-6-P-deglycase FrlB-like protein